MKTLFLGILFALGLSSAIAAQDVRITTFKDESTFVLNGQTFTISRNQDQNNRIADEFSLTSRQCPPFCIQPMQIVEGVTTVGELEVLEFLETKASGGTGLLIDSRVPEWFVKGSIPGAVNVPFVTLDEGNAYRNDILLALGAVASADGTLDFSNAFELMIFCNGPWCEQSTRAIRNLAAAGYPTDKLYYYRGGIQNWLMLGLTTTQPL